MERPQWNIRSRRTPYEGPDHRVPAKPGEVMLLASSSPYHDGEMLA